MNTEALKRRLVRVEAASVPGQADGRIILTGRGTHVPDVYVEGRDTLLRVHECSADDCHIIDMPIASLMAHIARHGNRVYLRNA